MLTASRMHRVMNGTQKGWQTLMAELLREINQPDQVLDEQPMYVEDMEHGKEFEDAARASAELELGVDIIQVGLAKHYRHKWLGASVDGLILKRDDAGLAAEIRRIFSRGMVAADLREFIGYVDATVEIKVFQSLQNHAYVWTNKRILDRYIPQVQSQSMVFEAPRSLFVSYHEQMPDPSARIAIVEVPPDLQYQAALLGRAENFNANFQMFRGNGGNLGVLAPNIPQRF